MPSAVVPSLAPTQLACACGASSFHVRLRRDEGIGLATCSDGGHPSLLFDSRDHWADLLSDGRPPEVRCRCKGRVFALWTTYTLREDGDVRAIALDLACVACRARRAGLAIDIDYGPTAALIARPLDPCPEPWLKARRVELTAYWTTDDAVAVVRHLVERDGAVAWLAPGRAPAAPASVDAIATAIAGDASYDIYLAPDARALRFADQREPWRRLPVIHLGTPTRMVLAGGVGLLFYLRWAEQVLVDGRPVAHDPALLALGARLRRFLAARFGSDRGRGTFDSADERARLRR